MFIFIQAIAIALIGLVVHWLKRFKRKQTGHNLLKYLRLEAGYTVMSLAGIVISASTIVAAGNVDISDPQVIAMLVMAGYTSDSVLNKAADEIY